MTAEKAGGLALLFDAVKAHVPDGEPLEPLGDLLGWYRPPRGTRPRVKRAPASKRRKRKAVQASRRRNRR